MPNRRRFQHHLAVQLAEKAPVRGHGVGHAARAHQEAVRQRQQPRAERQPNGGKQTQRAQIQPALPTHQQQKGSDQARQGVTGIVVCLQRRHAERHEQQRAGKGRSPDPAQQGQRQARRDQHQRAVGPELAHVELGEGQRPQHEGGVPAHRPAAEIRAQPPDQRQRQQRDQRGEVAHDRLSQPGLAEHLNPPHSDHTPARRVHAACADPLHHLRRVHDLRGVNRVDFVLAEVPPVKVVGVQRGQRQHQHSSEQQSGGTLQAGHGVTVSVVR